MTPPAAQHVEVGDAVITRWPSLTETKGQTAPVSWFDLFAKFKKPAPFLGDMKHPGWSPAAIVGERNDANVKTIGALVRDYDGGSSLDDLDLLWCSYFGLLHTTRKSTAENVRARAIIPLSRAVTVTEHAWVIAWAEAQEQKAGIKADPSTKNPSRFWYEPGALDVSAYQARNLTGGVLDVDHILREQAAKRTAKAAPPPPRSTHRVEDSDRITGRARSYVERMPIATAGAHGHDAAFDVALVLVKGFALSDADAFDILSEYSGRCVPPWSEKELRHKLDDAAKANKVTSGWLLEDDRRDWRTFTNRSQSQSDEKSSTQPFGQAPEAKEQGPSQKAAWKTPAERARALGGQGERLATLMATLDKATRGGFLACKVIIYGGAPGAGKTTSLVHQGVKWAQQGVWVAILAADEDADGLLIRVGQVLGLSREDLEDGKAEAREQLAEMLEALPNLILVDADEEQATVEEASAELERRAEGKPTVLIVDSVQTARVIGIEEAKDLRVRANMVMDVLKSEGKKRRHRVIATCELARGAYRSQNAADRIDDLAAFKESGGIEYGAALAMVLRSVPGDGGLVDVTMPKNRMGQKLPFRMALNFTRATFSEVDMPVEGANSAVQSMKSKVVEIVTKSIQPITSKAEIRRRAKAKRDIVWEAIDELLEEGELEIIGKAFCIPSPIVPNRPGDVATCPTVPPSPPLRRGRGTGTVQNGGDGT